MWNGSYYFDLPPQTSGNGDLSGKYHSQYFKRTERNSLHSMQMCIYSTNGKSAPVKIVLFRKSDNLSGRDLLVLLSTEL